jgi:hypothetical protein
MSKTYRTVIIGGPLNSTGWKKGSELYPSVSLTLMKEQNIYIRGTKVSKYSMGAFMIDMDSVDDEDSNYIHALFEFDLGYISIPTRKFIKMRDYFL